MKLLVLICSIILSLHLYSQNTLPPKIKIKKIEYLDTSNSKQVYYLSKKEKKAFLFYDFNSENQVEVMLDGCDFIFNNTTITIFPIYFWGQFPTKKNRSLDTKIPVQVFKFPQTSIFKEFNLNSTDFPILIVYNEDNKLCGFAKNVENIANINCEP